MCACEKFLILTDNLAHIHFFIRCQVGPYCTDNPCKNSGKCIDSLDGPVCECEAGFQGDR